MTSAYLDHAATTPMRAEAVEAMLPLLTEGFANPSGSHRASRRARLALDEARDTVADVLGVAAGEIVFTSGGTESDNAAVLGARRKGIASGRAIAAATEHHAVLAPVEYLGGHLVAVTPHATVDLDRLAETLDPDVGIVAAMAVNNEVGVIQPLADIALLVRRLAPSAVLHVDAVQAASWIDLRAITAVADTVALSAHKFGGPKGVGVLWVRDGVVLRPLLHGGGQERDRRSGTHNVAGIVATAVALDRAAAERDEVVARVRGLRDRFLDGLLAVDDVVETVPRDAKVAGSAHVCVAGCDSEELLFAIDRHDVSASAASACASGAMEPSHVLAAMGIDRQLTRGAMRFTFGWASTDAEVDHALAVVPAAIRELRARRSAWSARRVGVMA